MQYKNQSVLFPISSRYERYCTAKRHLRERSGGEVFPVGETNKAITRQQPKEKESKNEVTQTITATYHKGGKGSHIQQLNQPKHSNDRVYSDKGLSPTLNTMQGGNRSPFVVQQDEVWKYIDNWNEYMISSKGRLYSVKSNLFPTSFLGYFNSKENAYNKYFDEFIKLNKYEPWRRQPFIKNPLKGKTKYGWHFEQNVFDETGISRSLKASEGSGNRLKIIKPTLTPNRAKKRQKGRRMKEDGEPMFTLTGQDVHGVTIIDKKGNPKNKNHASTLTGGGHSGGNHSDMDLLAMRWQRTEKGKNARKESQKQGRDYTPFSDGHRELVPVKGKPVGALTAQAVAKDSLIGNHTRIRRLTPTECERLQGFEDGFTEFGIDNNYHIRYNKSSNKLDLCKQSTIKKLNSKNVQWKIVKENKLPILVTASCTIKDGKEQEQLNLLKKSFNEIKSVNIAIKKLEKSGQWECVINIIKCGEIMETHSMWKIKEVNQIVKDISGIEKEKPYKELKWKNISEENCCLVKYLIILTVLKPIIESLICTFVQELNIWLSINNLDASCQNQLIMEVLFLKTESIVKISDSIRYKCLGNAVTTNVIKAIMEKLL